MESQSPATKQPGCSLLSWRPVLGLRRNAVPWFEDRQGRGIQTVRPDFAAALITSEQDAIKLTTDEIDKWHAVDTGDSATALLHVAIVRRFSLSVTTETLRNLGELSDRPPRPRCTRRCRVDHSRSDGCAHILLFVGNVGGARARHGGSLRYSCRAGRSEWRQLLADLQRAAHAIHQMVAGRRVAARSRDPPITNGNHL